MKQKQLFFILITLSLIFLSGCFKVDRNNPFDPDSKLPSSEKYVKVKGHVYRGYSDEVLPNAEIRLGNQWAVSNGSGYYEISTLPGEQQLEISKDGWMTDSYSLNVPITPDYTHREDLNLFIWFEDFDTYTVNATPPQNNPWSYNISVTTGVFQHQVLDTAGERYLDTFIQTTGDPMSSAEVYLYHIPTPNHDDPRITEACIQFGAPNSLTEYQYTLFNSGGGFTLDVFINQSNISIGTNGIVETTIGSFDSYWDVPIIIQTYVNPQKDTLYLMFLDTQNFNYILNSPHSFDISAIDYKFGSISYNIYYRNGVALWNLDGLVSLFWLELY